MILGRCWTCRRGEEPAAAHVKSPLEEAQCGARELYTSVINLGEILYRLGKAKDKPASWETLAALRHLPLTIVPAIGEAVFAAACLKMYHPISYADAFAAATAESLDAILATGDPELEQLGTCLRLERLR